MKEASIQVSSLSLQKLAESYKYINNKYLLNRRRRGMFPTIKHPTTEKSQQQIITSNKSIECLKSTQYSYPISTLGYVECCSRQMKKVGVGVIIDKNLILTVAINCIFSAEEISEKDTIWFKPFSNQSDKGYKVQKIHPSNLRNYKNTIRQQPNSDIYNIAILQLDERVNLQNEYGSLGYNFAEDPVRNPFLMGISFGENKEFQKRYIELLNRQVDLTQNHLIRQNKNVFTYRIGEQFLAGSPIVCEQQGQYQIRGLHLSPKSYQPNGVKLNKINFQQFNKLIFKAMELVLQKQKISTKCLESLFEMNLKRLVYMDLQNTLLDDRKFKRLVQLKCQNLIHLFLNHNNITSDGFESILRSNWRLENLQLSSNSLSWESTKILSKINWRNLHKLWLGNNRIGNKGVSYLIQSDWRHLQHLNLERIEMDDNGCEHIQRGNWRFLVQIELGRNKITSRGIDELLKANWRLLQHIDLSSNKYHDEGCKRLIKSDWTVLKSLRVQKNTLAKGCWVKSKLKEKNPRLYIV